MSFYRRLSIRKQIFVALVAIVVITTMAFGAVLYAASSRTISQEYGDRRVPDLSGEHQPGYCESDAEDALFGNGNPRYSCRQHGGECGICLAERFQPAVHSAVFSYGQYSGTGLGAGRGGRQRKGVSLDCLGI